MIKLIVGLGNPGQQYDKTRHNAGFWFVERFGSAWVTEKKFNGCVANVEIARQKVQLLKPLTFMNLSGQSVLAIMRYYQVSAAECLVVHDELDFEPGVVRLKQGGGHAGHNGLRSIIASVGSNEFNRLRIGIGRPSSSQAVADYVLAAPSREDFVRIDAAIDHVFEHLEALVTSDIQVVMQKLHV